MMQTRGPPKKVPSKRNYIIIMIFGLIVISLFIIYINIETECVKAIGEDCAELNIKLGDITIGKIIGPTIEQQENV